MRAHGARLCVCAYGYCSLSLSLSPNLIDCLLDSMTLSTRSDVSVLILLLCCPQAYQVLLWLLAATARAPRVFVYKIYYSFFYCYYYVVDDRDSRAATATATPANPSHFLRRAEISVASAHAAV